MSKAKVVIISAIPPHPADSGGAKRIDQELQILASDFDLSLITWSSQPFPKSRLLNNQLILSISKRSLLRITETSPWPFLPWHNLNQVEIIMTFIRKVKPDAIQLEFSQLLWLIPHLITLNVPIIYVAHEIATVSFGRASNNHVNFLKRFWYWYQWRRIIGYEKILLKQPAAIVAMSEKDKHWLSNLHSNVIVAPNGITGWHPTARPRTNTIGFLGSVRHWPNREALLWLLDHLPSNPNFNILTTNSTNDIALLINRCPESIKKSIKTIGYVADLSTFFSKIDLLVVPLLSGSGTRIKILDALSYGVPVLSSPIGAEGLPLHDFPLLIIHDLNSTWSSTISDLLAQPPIFEINNQRNKLEKFSWDKVLEPNIKLLKSLIKSSD